MSATRRAAIYAITSRVEIEARDHAARVEEAMRGWPDASVREPLTQGIDRMARYCLAVPQLAVAWAEVLISHAELLDAAWRAANDRVDVRADPRVQAPLDNHVRALSRLCAGAKWVSDQRGRMGTRAAAPHE